MNQEQLQEIKNQLDAKLFAVLSAELARLKGLVVDAYMEGWQDSKTVPDCPRIEAFEMSETKLKLSGPCG